MVQRSTECRNTAFTDLLERKGVVLLDGGLATQLEAQGCDLANELWSASLLQSEPAEIIAAHRAYIEAGAECISNASYQASREGFERAGLDANAADELMLRSLALAEIAREESCSQVAIAVSLGPYGAMLHDGSEYNGDYGVSSSIIENFHRERLTLFDAAAADVLALETIPSLQEASVLANLLRDYETPAWVSFSCRNDKELCDGTPIEEAVTLFTEHPTVVAVGVNCTSPQFVRPLIERARRVCPDMRYIAYPNSGEIYNAGDNSWTGTVTPGDCAEAALSWIDAGAKAIGGCCRMGPEHIRAMRSAIAAMN